MRKTGSSHTIDVVFVLMLACAFAASILMVLMLGANTYSNIQRTSDAHFNERVSISYVTARVRSIDAADRIRVGEFEGISALFLDEKFYGEEYSTIIYSYDGWLKELFTDKASTLEQDSWLTLDIGTALIETEPLYFTMITPNLLKIRHVSAAGNDRTVAISLRSEMGGAQ